MLIVNKEIRINVRTTEQIKTDLEVAAKLRGLTVSALVNSLVVKVIREEKEREPQAFKSKPVLVPHEAEFEAIPHRGNANATTKDNHKKRAS